jgi:hypothetical protein
MNECFNSDEFFKKIPILENKENKRVVVYTAIFRDYDELNEPEKIEVEIDYFCFTDNPFLVSDKWNIILLPSLYRDSRMSARALKILSHKIMMSYDFSVWVDGSCTIVDSIVNLVFNFCEGKSICSFRHRDRDCIYQEARTCQLLGKDKYSIISKQMDWYKSLGYPKNNGLIETTILVRQNNEKDVKTLNEEWWNIVNNHSNRDQLSFNFILWKYGIENKVLGSDPSIISFFYIKPHSRMTFYSKNGGKINRIRSMLSYIYLKLRLACK